jgi:hypothetical protein
MDVKWTDAISDAIKESRVKIIGATLHIIDKFVEKFTAHSGEPECIIGTREDRYTCDTMTLGSLLKSAAKMGTWPKPEEPYCGIIYNDLSTEINEMKLLDLSKHNNKHGCHNYGDSIVNSLAQMELHYSGLKLWDFKQRR